MPAPKASTYYAELVASRRATLSAETTAILGNTTDIVCEIGSGHGHCLTAYAREHPKTVCVGVDIIGERVARALRKRNRAGLTHLHFLHADARLFLEILPAGVWISRVFVLFPDPWPKTRHHKHRILQSEFLTQLRARVHPGAELFFRTDHEPYFLEAQASVQDHRDWRLADIAWPFEYETVFQQRASTYHSFGAVPQS